jgi:hypothetical protein
MDCPLQMSRDLGCHEVRVAWHPRTFARAVPPAGDREHVEVTRPGWSPRKWLAHVTVNSQCPETLSQCPARCQPDVASP